MTTMFEMKAKDFETYLYEKALCDLFFADYIEDESEPNSRYWFVRGAASILERDPAEMMEDYLLLLREIDPSMVKWAPDRPCSLSSKFVNEMREYYKDYLAEFDKPRQEEVSE